MGKGWRRARSTSLIDPLLCWGGRKAAHGSFLFSVSALLLVSALVFLICLVGFKLFLYYSFFFYLQDCEKLQSDADVQSGPQTDTLKQP